MNRIKVADEYGTRGMADAQKQMLVEDYVDIMKKIKKHGGKKHEDTI
jgi:hypothetical protein